MERELDQIRLLLELIAQKDIKKNISDYVPAVKHGTQLQFRHFEPEKISQAEEDYCLIRKASLFMSNLPNG